MCSSSRVAPYAEYTPEDHAGAIAELQGAAPEVVFVTDERTTILNPLIADIRAAGITATLLGGDGWDTPDLQLDAAEAALFPSFFTADDERQTVVDFVAAYQDYFEEEPDVAALGYDTMTALLLAISEAGVDDASAVRDALQQLVFEGVTGVTRFDDVGDVVKGLAIVQVQDGQRALLTRFEPVVGLTVANSGPVVLGETIAMTATVAEGGVVSYEWDLGDGTTAAGASITHTYATAGARQVVVTATNVLNSLAISTTAIVKEEVVVSSGSVVTTTDSRLELAVPPTLSETLTVTYTPQLTSTGAVGDLLFGGISFSLQATDGEGNPIVELAEPFTLTVRYTEADLAPGTDESMLGVWRWDDDAQDWVALEVVSRDTEGNTITVLLDHLSEFALLAPVQRHVYVPLLQR